MIPAFQPPSGREGHRAIRTFGERKRRYCYLRDEDYKLAKQRASAIGASFSLYIEELVTRDLDKKLPGS